MNANITSTTHEVLFCRGTNPSLVADSDVTTDGRKILRWNSVDLVPAKAREVCNSALMTIAATCGVDASKFSIEIQTVESAEAGSGRMYGGLVLRLTTDDAETLRRARSYASSFAAVLGQLPNAWRGRAARSSIHRESEGAEESRLTIDDLVEATFLGVPVPVPMDLLVPGYGALRVQGRFKRRTTRSRSSRNLEVRGHLRWVKTGGKSNRIFVNGVVDTTGVSFGNRPILFDEKFRDALAQALAEPTTPLRLELVEERLDDGRAKPRIKYLLDRLEFTSASRQVSLAAANA